MNFSYRVRLNGTALGLWARTSPPHTSFPRKRESTMVAGGPRAMAASVVPLAFFRTWYHPRFRLLRSFQRNWRSAC